MKKPISSFLVLFTLLAVFSLGCVVAFAQNTDRSSPDASGSATKPSIVLVHGAFADGSAWSRVIPLLEKDGYVVIAVQDNMTSLNDDIVTTRRVLAAQKGPIVLVGHSYGGAVITGAAANNDQVKALVYIAAFAPDAGEAVGAVQSHAAPSALGPALVPDSAGFLYIDRAKFHEVFAKDVSAAEARIMAATQRPIAAVCFEQTVPSAAWKSIPSWYLVASDDQAINPDLERFMAKRIGATTIEVKSSHVPFLSHPKVVADLIEKAARNQP
jgi:pimeloyl-ACP methyl ester carboxylesterase